MAARNRQASASADGLLPARSGGSDGLAGYIAAWPAADGRYTVGDGSQQELAGAVGLVREVVAGSCGTSVLTGWVATSSDSIHILGPAGLHELSWNPAAV